MSMPNDTTNADRTKGFWSAFIQILGMAAVLALLAMMLLTTADVIARYAFNRPISGAFELTEILLATCVFLAMPLTTRMGEHVKVDLLKTREGSTPDIVLNVLGILAGAGVFAMMAWQVWEHAHKLQKYGTASNSLSIPISVVAFLVAICCAISALAALLSLRDAK